MRNAECGLRNRKARPLAPSRRLCHSAFRTPHSGFTIAELIVVLAILGITAAAVVPALARVTSEDDLTGAMRQVESLCATARGRALERAAPVSVTLLPATGAFWMTTADGAPLDSGALALPAGVRLESAALRPTLRFDPLGTVDGDTLVVVGETGARLVVVDRWTGEVRHASR